jgi:hypothetical protein
MSKIIKKKAAVKKKKKTAAKKQLNVLKGIGAVTRGANIASSAGPANAITRGIAAYRAAIHPGNGYGEIEIKETNGTITKIFAATNPALYTALLLSLTNPTKSITQGGYIYVTG